MEKEEATKKPPAAPAPPAEKPEKREKNLNRTKSTVFNDEVKVKNIPSFTLDQLVDLALCAPEIGAVNFNILRMLLRDLVERAGAAGVPASLTELEAHQAENFKKYLEGMSVASPMPGVLRIGQQGPPPPRTPGAMKASAPVTPRTGRPGEVIATRRSFAAVTPPGAIGMGAQTDDEEEALHEKVGRLEKQLDVLNDLPSNKDLLLEARSGAGKSISVSEMWQIIQLNNRIAAAEAAIQKMATLIEDLAKNVGKMKHDAKTLTVDTKELATASSDLQMQGQGLIEKYGQFDDILGAMQKEMQEIKQGWKQDRDNLEKVLGVDLGKIPTFMKERGPLLRKGPPHPPRGPPEADADQSERSTQTFARGQPRGKPKDQLIPPEDIAKLTADEIAENITPEELTRMTPALYKQLTPEQKKALGSVRKSIKLPELPLRSQRPMGVEKMTDAELSELSPEDILEKMPYDEAMGLSQEVLAKMTDEQKEMVRKVIERGPGRRITSRRDLKMKKQKDDSKSILKPKSGKQPKLGVVSMTQDQLKDLKSTDISQNMSYDEAKSIPQAVLDKMRQSQQDAIKRILEEGPPEGYKERSQKSALGLASMSKAELKELSVNDIEGMPYSEAKNLPSEILEQLTEEQRAAIQQVLDAGPPKRESVDDEYDDEFDDEGKPKRPSEKRKTLLTKDEIEMVAELPPYLIAETITPEEAASIPEEVMKKRFTMEQIEEINKLKSKRLSKDEAAKLASEMAELLGSLEEQPGEGEEEEGDEEEEFHAHAHEEETEMSSDYRRRSSAEGEEEHEHEMDTDGEDGYGRKKKSQRGPRHRGPKEKKHKRRKTHKRDKSTADEQQPVEAEQPPQMTLDEYLNSLSPEEAANMAADAVQKEMEKQYKQLQGMQRQLAQDIQEKMEFIYQKLIKEIASNQMASSPFTIGGVEECFGPGICQGQNMPAGVTVCQVDAEKERRKSLLSSQGAEGAKPETVCPGPGPCPGAELCPYCKADASAKEALKSLEGSDKKKAVETKVDAKGKPTTSDTHGKRSELEDTLLQEIKSLILLDLDQIRQDMKSHKFGAYDEQDILERLGAVWEALKILKNNEESLALKLARQDMFLKKIHPKTIEKLQKIPDENLEALITGDLGRIGMDFTPDGRRGTLAKGHDHNVRATLAAGPGRASMAPGNANAEDIQTLFDNLANVIAECAEQKERIDQIADTSRVLESAMVTKQMLYDAMGDKADRGLINTKVSYDEFGSTIDEVNNQLNNLMVESYQRNENWKKVTSDMAAELAEKLDRVELAPLRAFFKSHLKELEEEVKDIVRIVKEPNPAGTRKKFLRDYNCLSCDRLVNISGFTNGPRLPTIGPMPAGHPTASKRALDVHRIRMAKQCDLSKGNLKDKRGSKTDRPRNIDFVPSSNQMANDMDVMQVVNRYTGGGGGRQSLTAPDISGTTQSQSKATDPVFLAASANRASARQSMTINQSGHHVSNHVHHPSTPVDT